MQLIIDSEKDSTLKLRAAAAFCLMLAGDVPVPSVGDETTAYGEGPPLGATGTNHIPSVVAPPQFVPPISTTSGPVPGTGFPPAPSVPVPNGTPVVMQTATASISTMNPVAPVAAPPIPPSVTMVPAHSNVSTSSLVVPEYDSAGLPWDARIHNKGRTKKKDGTWKLTKGLDPTFAQAIVKELVAAKAQRAASPERATGMLPQLAAGFPQPPMQLQSAANVGMSNTSNTPMVPPLPVGAGPMPIVPPPPPPPPPATVSPPVSLPPTAFNTPMPMSMVPPPPVASGSTVVSPPNGSGAVPQPNGAAVTPYRALMDKLTQAVNAKVLNPSKIAPVVQHHGAPNFAELGGASYVHLVPQVERDFDMLIAGLPLDYLS